MALISNFELLLKPIAPPGGPATEVARIAVQGYFLEISNLESNDITLIFRTRTSVRGATDSVNTELTSTNHNLVYDITQDNNFAGTIQSAGQLIANKQLGHAVVCLTLPAGQTASLALLPNVQALLPVPGNPPPDLAIRGYTELLLNSNVDTIFPLSFSSPESARVLVSPEHRATFIDPEFDPTDFANQPDLDFDQSAYSLPTANGQAQQLLNTHATFNNPFQDFLTSDFGASFSIPSQGSNQLSTWSNQLPLDANAANRKATLMLGSVPTQLEYSIKNGKYFVEEEGVARAISLLMRKKRIAKKSIPSTRTMIKKINAALAGDLKAEAQVEKLFEKLF